MEFSLRRTWMVMRKQWMQNRRLYLLGLLSVCGLEIGAIILHRSPEEYILVYGMIIAGTLFTSSLLKDLGAKKSAIAFLMLPASPAEKLIAAGVYSLVIFPILFLAISIPIFKVADYIFSDILGYAYRFFPHASKDGRQALFFYVVGQAFVLLGATFFRRLSLVKTIVAACLIGSVLLWLQDSSTTSIKSQFEATIIRQLPVLPGEQPQPGVVVRPFGGAESSIYYTRNTPAEFGLTNITIPDRNFSIEPPAWLKVYYSLFLSLITPVLLLSALFGLKEKQLK